MCVQSVTQAECRAQVLVIVIPGQLDIASAVVLVGVSLTVRTLDRDGLAIRAPAPFPVLFNWLPFVIAFVFDCREHVGGPSVIVHISIAFELSQHAFNSVYLRLTRDGTELSLVSSEKLVV